MFCRFLSLHSSTAFGGGVDNSGSMTITNCTISGNSAVATATWIRGMAAEFRMVAIFKLRAVPSHIILHQVNHAFGGGIYGFGPTRTDSSIIALNSASTGPDFTGAGGLQSTGYNIIGNNADAVINSQPTDQIGTPASPIDPLLGPLADNGGPTLTHALQPGSPAINRGDPAAPPRDQRGYSRLGVPDVGAFEFNGIPPTPTPTPTPPTPDTHTYAYRYACDHTIAPRQHQFSELCSNGRQRDDWRIHRSRDSNQRG